MKRRSRRRRAHAEAAAADGAARPPPHAPADDASPEDADKAAASTELGELAPYVSGEATPPVPTFFVGAAGAAAAASLAALASAPPSCTIHHLGRAGVAPVAGLSVAFLDGTFAPAAAAAGPTPPGAPHFSGADIDALQTALHASTGEVDLFLTCEWPAGVLSALPAAARPAPAAVPAARGSAPVAALSDAVRPRYHVAGGGGGFFARAPYVNPDKGAGISVTRFLGLGPVGGPSKWLHALKLAPAAAAPTDVPPDATASPYSMEASVAAKRPFDDDGADPAQPWRWAPVKRGRGGGRGGGPPRGAPSAGRPGVIADNRKTVYVGNVSPDATEAEIEAHFAASGAPVVDVRRRGDGGGQGGLQQYAFVQFADVASAAAALALDGSSLVGRTLHVEPAGGRGGAAAGGPLPPPPRLPVADCWFCLSNPNADVDLVVSVGTDVYCAVDKGPIVEGGHALVLPVEHAPSSLALPAPAAAEIDAYLDALEACYKAQGWGLFTWERYAALRARGGNHAQINALAVPAERVAGATAALLAAADAAGVALVRVPGPARAGEPSRGALRDAVGDGEFYVATAPDGSRYAAPVPRGERHPLSFGRDAAAAVAGAPERADWKACQVAPPAEVARAEAFKAAFKAHDPAGGGE